MPIEFLIWGAGAAILGLFLGYLGFLYSKLAYSIFTICITAFIYLSNFILSLLGIERGASEAAAGGAFGFVESIVPFRAAIENMGYLPAHIRVAIITFAVTFFLSRIATWAYKSYGPKPAEETAEQRKKRVLREYGMTSMDDIRSLR